MQKTLGATTFETEKQMSDDDFVETIFRRLQKKPRAGKKNQRTGKKNPRTGKKKPRTGKAYSCSRESSNHSPGPFQN